MEALEPIEVQRRRCMEYRNVLRDLTRIHIEIDAPRRKVGVDEPGLGLPAAQSVLPCGSDYQVRGQHRWRARDDN